jgi:hypothetical protein
MNGLAKHQIEDNLQKLLKIYILHRNKEPYDEKQKYTLQPFGEKKMKVIT